MKIPRPGRVVRGSKSGSPIMAMFDLLGRRWSMGVLWTLSEQGPCTFRALQSACETISPAVLNARLKELQAAGFVMQGEGGYQVTELGRDAYRALIPLSQVSKNWAIWLSDNPESVDD
ncbi:winged helix-turn-helix transcriptional regulator [Kiloniella majae]|uniref:winged helix-turn-helix transcriptional regulator n=1 Tax=Kiloniella majae TaxID=1938558 RepID=UPI000A279232|nr:helix-turn-helix domain-containing protein [Kiloniella majae]